MKNRKVADGKRKPTDSEGRVNRARVTTLPGDVVQFCRLLAQILRRGGEVAKDSAADAYGEDETLN